MALLNRMATYDSIQEMDAARMDRYRDGLACAKDGRSFGAAYLLGYTIEMSLKVAYFRVLGLSEVADLGPEVKIAQRLGKARGFKNLHDLEAWARLLVSTRVARRNPLDPVLAVLLQTRATDAAQNWSEVMRYRGSIPAETEYTQLLRVADWVNDCFPKLWN